MRGEALRRGKRPRERWRRDVGREGQTSAHKVHRRIRSVCACVRACVCRWFPACGHVQRYMWWHVASLGACTYTVHWQQGAVKSGRLKLCVWPVTDRIFFSLEALQGAQILTDLTLPFKITLNYCVAKLLDPDSCFSLNQQTGLSRVIMKTSATAWVRHILFLQASEINYNFILLLALARHNMTQHWKSSRVSLS